MTVPARLGGVGLWRRWRRRMALSAADCELHGLNDAALRDIGLTQSEIPSLRAELEGRVEVTRLHALSAWKDRGRAG
jgi:uncharacterized protein YjiS (DUF1127 family)